MPDEEGVAVVVVGVFELHVRARQRAYDFAVAEIGNGDDRTQLSGEDLARGGSLVEHRGKPDEEGVAVVVVGVKEERGRARRIAAVTVTGDRTKGDDRHERPVARATLHCRLPDLR